MAKVIGPLFSQEARGQFGKSLVFTRRRGQNVVRGYVVPANPQTAGQIAQRIIFAVAGIITRRANQGSWGYASETTSVVEFWRTQTRTGEVWNSAFVRAMLGIDNAQYTEAQTAYAQLDTQGVAAWETAAETTIAGLVDYTRGTVTITTGFMLYLAEFALAEAGYGSSFASTAPVAVIDAS